MTAPTHTHEPRLMLRLFGANLLLEDGSPIQVGKKELILLCLLALSAEERVSRTTLINLIWNDGDDPLLRRRLHQICFKLRRRFRPLNPVLSEGEYLRLNRSVVRTDFHRMAEAARLRDMDTIGDLLTMTLTIPVSWSGEDDRVHDWLLPALRVRSELLSRYMRRSGQHHPVNDVLHVWPGFADLVVRMEGSSAGSVAGLKLDADTATEGGIEVWRQFLSNGMIRDMQGAHGEGISRLLALVSRSQRLLPLSDLARAQFRALWSLRAHWEEDSGGGRDAIEALREHRPLRRPDLMAPTLNIVLPVLELEGMIGNAPWHLEIMGDVQDVLSTPPESDEMARSQTLLRALIARWRLSHGALAGHPAEKLEQEMEALPDGDDPCVWLVRQEALALAATRRKDAAEAKVRYDSMLRKAIEVQDTPAIAVALGGLLAMGASIDEGEAGRSLQVLLSKAWIPRRERKLLQDGLSKWRLQHPRTPHWLADLDRFDA